MNDILQRIKNTQTWNDIDALRMDVIHERTTESLGAWQARERTLRHAPNGKSKAACMRTRS